jgi:hypothetical protein
MILVDDEQSLDTQMPIYSLHDIIPLRDIRRGVVDGANQRKDVCSHGITPTEEKPAFRFSAVCWRFLLSHQLI